MAILRKLARRTMSRKKGFYCCQRRMIENLSNQLSSEIKRLEIKALMKDKHTKARTSQAGLGYCDGTSVFKLENSKLDTGWQYFEIIFVCTINRC